MALKSSELAERTLRRRAVEAAIWGMPIVSFDAMRQAFFRDGRARYNDILYWSKPADWRLQITTPIASSHYVYFNFNIKNGPVVLEVPAAGGAGLFGSLLDAWQVPQVDVGPGGADLGKGGKYLLLPRGHKLESLDGYIPVPFETYNGYSVLRVVPASSADADVAKALDLMKKLRLYPLMAHPPQGRHIDMSGRLFDGITAFDDSFYDSLARMVNEEPVQARDLVALGQLRSLGIEKSKEFEPDAATREILREAIAEAHAGFMQAAAKGQSFWPGSHWIVWGTGVAVNTEFSFQTAEALDIDERGAVFFLRCAPPRKLGVAMLSLWSMRDGSGADLQGSSTYRLRVPPRVPVKQFWAVTVYDLQTAAFIRESPRIEVNSHDQKMHRNRDGSIDVFFGPDPPAAKRVNWVYTAAGKRWFPAFRFYGPEPALFDKTWQLPGLEPITAAQAAVAANNEPLVNHNDSRMLPAPGLFPP